MALVIKIVLSIYVMLHAVNGSPITSHRFSRQTSDAATPWSQENMTLRRGDSLYIFHNYTFVPGAGSVSSSQARYLFREFRPQISLPRFRFREPWGEPSKLHERGFIINPNSPHRTNFPGGARHWVSWKWLDKSGGSFAVIIPFCFKDVKSRDDLSSYLERAFQLWREPLGDARGVDFRLPYGNKAENVEHSLCRNPEGKWAASVPTWSVEISRTDGKGGVYNGLGYIFGREPGRMNIKFGPLTGADHDIDDYEQTNIRDLAHEVGHVLGLDHEHQRYDAPQWIKVHADRVRNVAQLDDHVQQYNRRYPNNPITADQVKTDLRAAEKISDEINDVAQFSQLLPARRLSNAEVLFDSELSGPFDWNSIMLYKCSAFSEKTDAPALTKIDGSKWKENMTPSNGDVEAVRRLYPDVDPDAVPPAAPAGPSRPRTSKKVLPAPGLAASSTSKASAPSVPPKPSSLRASAPAVPSKPSRLAGAPISSSKSPPPVPPKPSTPPALPPNKPTLPGVDTTPPPLPGNKPVLSA